MNATITKNNLELFLKKLDSNTKLNEEWMCYKSFLKDGVLAIDIFIDLVKEKDEIIRVNFKEDLKKAIDTKQDKIKLITLEKENLHYKELLKEMEKKVEKVLNEF